MAGSPPRAGPGPTTSPPPPRKPPPPASHPPTPTPHTPPTPRPLLIYLYFSAALTFHPPDLRDPAPSDIMISNVPPQISVQPVNITTQELGIPGPAVNLTGSLNTILLTGSLGQAIPGLGGRDY